MSLAVLPFPNVLTSFIPKGGTLTMEFTVLVFAYILSNIRMSPRALAMRNAIGYFPFIRPFPLHAIPAFNRGFND